MKKVYLTQCIRAAASALFCLLGVAVTQAATVYFDDADRGPSATLEIGGVTVSPYHVYEPLVNAQPATLSGQGLGNAAIGAFSSVDRQMHYSTGALFPDGDILEGLTLSVNGQINSITVRPLFSVLATGDPVQLPFDMLASGDNGRVRFIRLDPSDSSAITIIPDTSGGTPLPSSINLYIQGNSRQDLNFASYRQTHSPDETFVFGVNITSLDFTPVPEPNTLTFLALGLVGVLCVRRSRTRKELS